jgi:hypothetical protein
MRAIIHISEYRKKLKVYIQSRVNNRLLQKYNAHLMTVLYIVTVCSYEICSFTINNQYRLTVQLPKPSGYAILKFRGADNRYMYDIRSQFNRTESKQYCL